MKKIMQTRFDAETGNCFHACVASVLDRPITEIPDFTPLNVGEEEDGTWFTPWKAWFDEQGIGWFYFNFADYGPQGKCPFLLPNNMHVIIAGLSPRGPHNHAVVGRYEVTSSNWGFQMVHDPSPRGGFITGPVIDMLALWPSVKAGQL